MGIMRLPFMLGIVPPVTGVLSLPAYLVMTLLEKRGLNNELVQTLIGVTVQLPLSFLTAVLVTPLDDKLLWQCIIGN